MGVFETISMCKRTIPNEHTHPIKPSGAQLQVHDLWSMRVGVLSSVRTCPGCLNAALHGKHLVPSAKHWNPQPSWFLFKVQKAFLRFVYAAAFLSFILGAQKDLQPMRGEFRITCSASTSYFGLLCSCQDQFASPAAVKTSVFSSLPTQLPLTSESECSGHKGYSTKRPNTAPTKWFSPL